MNDFNFASASSPEEIIKIVAAGQTEQLEQISSDGRSVFIHPLASGYVLKYDSTGNINQREANVWRQYGRLRQFIAPVAATSTNYKWIAMERARKTATWQQAYNLWRQIDNAGFGCTDFYHGNVGIFHNGPRMIDYESCKPKSEMSPADLRKWNTMGPE